MSKLELQCLGGPPSPRWSDRHQERIRAVTQNGSLEVSELDLGDLSSVKSFRLSGGDRPCDVLILNAGVMAIPQRATTEDGFERHLGVNHLGPLRPDGAALAGEKGRKGGAFPPLSCSPHSSPP